jgi:transcriptional regulator with XRE-family HTH domain
MDVNDPLAAALGIDLSDAEGRRGIELAYEDQHWLASLVRFRRASRLTQQDVAERMKTSQEAVSRFEKLGNDPRLSTIRRYAMAIGIGSDQYGHKPVEAPREAASPPVGNVLVLQFSQAGSRAAVMAGTSAGPNVRPSVTEHSAALVNVV